MLKQICMHKINIYLTFLATKSTTSRAAAKQPAAILAVIRLVDARMKTIPQNDEPRSGCRNIYTLSVTLYMDAIIEDNTIWLSPSFTLKNVVLKMQYKRTWKLSSTKLITSSRQDQPIGATACLCHPTFICMNLHSHHLHNKVERTKDFEVYFLTSSSNNLYSFI